MTPSRPATRPTVAAVIVNYNYARYLPEAVESLLVQETPFDDIVVVNDGSTDDSMQVLTRYRDRIRVLDIPNGGQLGACRAGLAAVTTDYVYFLDADDFARPHLLTTVLAQLSGTPVKMQFQLEGVSAGVEQLESVFPTYPAGYNAARMRADNRSIGFYVCPPTSGNVYLRMALLELRLDTLDQRDFIDGPPTLALPHVGDVQSLDVPLAAYRVHGGSHSQWSEPTAELLNHETEWFDRRWAQTAGLLGMDGPPFGVQTPLYVLERELMVAALGNRRTTAVALRMLRCLPATNLPGRQKLLLAGWAVALIVPAQRLRTSLVRARRSPVNRSKRMRKILRVLLRGQLRRVHRDDCPTSSDSGHRANDSLRADRVGRVTGGQNGKHSGQGTKPCRHP